VKERSAEFLLRAPLSTVAVLLTIDREVLIPSTNANGAGIVAVANPAPYSTKNLPLPARSPKQLLRRLPVPSSKRQAPASPCYFKSNFVPKSVNKLK
jgi:hypothetical protein